MKTNKQIKGWLKNHPLKSKLSCAMAYGYLEALNYDEEICDAILYNPLSKWDYYDMVKWLGKSTILSPHS